MINIGIKRKKTWIRILHKTIRFVEFLYEKEWKHVTALFIEKTRGVCMSPN